MRLKYKIATYFNIIANNQIFCHNKRHCGYNIKITIDFICHGKKSKIICHKYMFCRKNFLSSKLQHNFFVAVSTSS